MHKTSVTALRDQLTGALIGIARATDGSEHLISESSTALLIQALCADQSDPWILSRFIRCAAEEKRKMVPDCFVCACPCGRTSDYNMADLDNAEPQVRDLKTAMLSGIRNTANFRQQYASIPSAPQIPDRLFYTVLICIGMEDWNVPDLLPYARMLSDLHHQCSLWLQSDRNEPLSKAWHQTDITLQMLCK